MWRGSADGRDPQDLAAGAVRKNGAEALARHFERVKQEDVATRAVFDSHADASVYLATFDQALAGHLPRFEGPREYAGATTVFPTV